MTNEDAFYIQQSIGELEFPFTYEKALQFALFRTYGIPSISKLLVQTSEFSEAATATKRYADTVLLIAEFAGHHPQSERSIEAIGRMNYIHHQYQKAGKISNDDMLYTLSLFAMEPVRWIERFEWRELEDFEKCAFGTFWKAIGDAMNISYDGLKGGESDGSGWRDGLDWLEKVDQWAQGYEERCMVPDEHNRKTANETVAILLWSVPQSLKPYGRKVVGALMDDRLRKAMMSVSLKIDVSLTMLMIFSSFGQPSIIYPVLVSIIFGTRRFFLRYFSLPRPYFMRSRNLSDEPSKEGKYFMTRWETVPWYVKPTLRNRWSLQSWWSWIMRQPYPGADGDKYRPNGYKIPEIGPRSMQGRGGEYMKESKERIVTERMKGCPFVRAKAI